MDNVLEKRLKVGVSECCFGSKVRYNGKGFDYIKYFGREKEQFTFYPLCPECLAGLGVPRKPISIKGGSGEEVLQGLAKIKSRSGEDVTEKLIKACNYSLELLKSEGIYICIRKVVLVVEYIGQRLKIRGLVIHRECLALCYLGKAFF